MRRSAVAIAGVCLLITGCGNSISTAESATPTRTMIPRPLVDRELAGLLLSPEQAAAIMGATALPVTETPTSRSYNGAVLTPPWWLALVGAAESQVYANSGFRAERDQSLNDGD